MMNKEQKEDIIREIFNDPKTGFVGIEKIFRKINNKNISRKDIGDFLKKQEVVQLTRKDNKKQRSFIPPYPLYEFQCDLIFIENKKLNNNSRYVLTCIDIFTKVADAEMLKKKDAMSVVEAMMKIFKRMGIPEYIYSDRGSEFIAESFKKMLKDKDIDQLFTIGHAPFIEVFNRTIKEMIQKYLISTNTKTIVNILPKMIDNYNNSYHSVIEMNPNQVSDKNKGEVYVNIYRKSHIIEKEKIHVGDRVRVSNIVRATITGDADKKGFKKGYKPKFSKNVFDVEKIVGNKYFIEGHPNYYYYSQLRKVGEIEKNTREADLDGTQEGRLKEMGKLPRVANDTVLPKTALEERREQPTRLRRGRTVLDL